MKPYLLPLLAVALSTSASYGAGCQQFFQGHGYRHHVQAVVAAPVYYFAGQATQDEALTRKAIRAELPAIVEAVRQSLQAPQAVQGGAVATKCARCHSGDNAKAGFRLDGDLDDATVRRSLEVLAGIDVPPGMKPVLDALKEGDHAAIMQDMLTRKPTGILR